MTAITTNAQVQRGISLTSSSIVRSALDLPALGTPAQQSCTCAMCGAHIPAGALQGPAKYGPAFTDERSLSCRSSKHICGDCLALITNAGLRASGFGVFSKQGVQAFRKWADIAEALRNPPLPPFVMCYATANNQHMAWRSVVNFSRDAFYVRVGLRDLLIRGAVLKEAMQACELLGALPGVAPKTAKNRKTLPNPFLSLSSDLKEPSHGRLHPGLYAAPAREVWTEQHERAMQLILSLTLGETWALRFLLTPGAGQTN